MPDGRVKSDRFIQKQSSCWWVQGWLGHWKESKWQIWVLDKEENKNSKGQFKRSLLLHGVSLVPQTVKNPPAMWEIWVQSLNWEKPLEEGMATYSSILDWRIPKDKRSLAGLTMLKPFTVWITTNYGKFLKEIEIPDHLTCLLRKLYAGQEATLRTRHGQWTSSKLGKEYIKSVCCHPAYLTYMQSTSCEMPGWMKQKLQSRL